MVGPKGRYVWLVKPGNTVEMTPIIVGRPYDGMEVVTQGLSSGDKVVTEGQLLLYPGAKILERRAKPPEPEQKQTDGATSSGRG